MENGDGAMNIGKYKRVKRTYVIYFRVSNFSFIKEIVWGKFFEKLDLKMLLKCHFAKSNYNYVLIKEI